MVKDAAAGTVFYLIIYRMYFFGFRAFGEKEWSCQCQGARQKREETERESGEQRAGTILSRACNREWKQKRRGLRQSVVGRQSQQDVYR